jgi:peptidoglycan/LPS O-acetylase OafA/YrhL
MSNGNDILPKTQQESIPEESYSLPMGYLRAFIVFLVVVHHSLIAYMGAIPRPAHQFAGGLMLWRAFPVVDSRHWAPAGIIVGINDVFFMSLMFLLSGLFVTQSVRRKGVFGYLGDRILRLGIPFLFCAFLVVPAAYYFAYLQSGGTPGLQNYWAAWQRIGYWPTGPAWFVSLLLAFDIAAAILFALIPFWTSWSGRLGAAEYPRRLFLLVLVVTAIAYVPLADLNNPSTWTYWGLFQFQTSRPLLYFAYFAVGANLGAYGVHRGLLLPEGRFARRWWLWLIAASGALFIGSTVLIAILTTKGVAQRIWMDVGAFSFVLSCGTLCFAFLGIFVRFTTRSNRLMDSLSANSYGIYLVHYFFVAAIQYALLSQPLSGAAKAGVVVAGALAASWVTTAILRRIPLVSRLVGG